MEKLIIILVFLGLHQGLVGYYQAPVPPPVPPDECEEEENCEDDDDDDDPCADDDEGGSDSDGSGSDGAGLTGFGFGGFGLTSHFNLGSSATEGESNVRTIDEIKELISRTDAAAAAKFTEASYKKARSVKIPWNMASVKMKALGSDGLLYIFRIISSDDDSLRYRIIAKDLDTGEEVRNETHTVVRGGIPVKAKAVYKGLRLAKTSGFGLTGGGDDDDGDDDDGGTSPDAAECPCDGTIEEVVNDDWTGCPRKIVRACDSDPYDAPRHRCFDSDLRVNYLGAFHGATSNPVTNSNGDTIGYKIKINSDTISKDSEDNDTWHPEFDISIDSDFKAMAIPNGGCCWIGGSTTAPFYNGVRDFAQSNGIFDLSGAGQTHFRVKLKEKLDALPADADWCPPENVLSMPVAAAILGNWGCTEVQDSYAEVRAEDPDRPENNKYIGVCRPMDEEDTNPAPRLISFPRGALPEEYRDICGCRQEACPPGADCDLSTCTTVCPAP